MSLRIERMPLEGPPLVEAYQRDYGRVAEFYSAGAPNQLQSYRATLERIRRAYPETRWNVLADHPTHDPAAREKLEAVIRERGVFVSTGQQAGLFVSPLFTLYKAMSAARLAERLEEALGLPVMPLFTIASEDHDWEEINHTHVLDLENRLTRLSVKAPAYEGADAPSPSVERIALGADVEDVLDELTQLIPDTEFRDAVLQPLRDAYRPGRGVAEAFEQALGHLLRRYGFLLSRTGHSYVKRETREVLWAEWENREASEERLLERSAALAAAGFESQVAIAEGATNLFVEGELGRDRLLRDGMGGRLRRSDERLDGEELRGLVEREPGRVSPGALLRPVTEARAFPVVAYVAGPSEIAYLAQSQVLFALHGLPAPVVAPRCSFQLIEAKVDKVLEKYQLEASALVGKAAAIQRILDEQTPQELREALRALRQSVGEGLERVEAAAVEVDPGSRSAVGSGKAAVFQGIDTLESKLQARVRERHEIMRQQLEKAAVNLYPDGEPQERVLNPYPYLVRYGESLLDEVYASVATSLD